MKTKMIYTIAALITIGSTSNALAATTDEQSSVLNLQKQWANIKYQTPKKERKLAFKALSVEAQQALNNYPNSTDLLIWQGIILSTYAGERGGLGALGIVKEAKTMFEKALKENPQALQGSAYTSLGSLYYQVPGWPIGFGNDKKAEKYLLQAVKLNPNGIDSNFFYGDFLLDQGKKKQAKIVLNKALQAPIRENRPLADKGRRLEIQALLKKLS
jgi:tetratricopeptide (TPR) repeat protein